MQIALYVVIKLTIYQATINNMSCSRFLDAGAGEFLDEAGMSPSGTLDPDSRNVTLSMNESTKEGASDKQSESGDNGDMPGLKSKETDSRNVTLSMNESTKEGASDKQSKSGDNGDMPVGKSKEKVHFSCTDIRLKGAMKREQQTRQERNSGNVANETKVSTINFLIVDQLRSC